MRTTTSAHSNARIERSVRFGNAATASLTTVSSITVLLTSSTQSWPVQGLPRGQAQHREALETHLLEAWGEHDAIDLALHVRGRATSCSAPPANTTTRT
jgi:hypothetical protein